MSLKVIAGCMFSAKTETLISLIKKESYRGVRVIVIRPSIDTRNDELESHSGFKLDRDNKNIQIIKTNSAKNMIKALKPIMGEPIFVDEFQFFNKEDAEYLLSLSMKGYEITVCGLALDSRGEDFGFMAWLMARATEVQILNAYCHRCGKPAFRTQRKYDRGDQVLIGSSNDYEAACSEHWMPR